jgi:hypothetical protein
VARLWEYGSNLNPNSTDAHILEPGTGTTGLPHIGVCEEAGGGGGGDDPPVRLRVEYLRRRTDPELSYVVEFASGLGAGDWQPAVGAETVTPVDASWERVVVEDTVTSETAASRFARVRLIRIQP